MYYNRLDLLIIDLAHYDYMRVRSINLRKCMFNTMKHLNIIIIVMHFLDTAYL